MDPDAITFAVVCTTIVASVGCLVAIGVAARLILNRGQRKIERPSKLEDDRMRRLETLGVITGYTITLDWESLGYPILALVNVRTSMGTCDEAVRLLRGLSNDGAIVEECYAITGDWCLFAKVRARSSRDLAHLLDAIKERPQFVGTSSALALTSEHEWPPKR